MTKRATLLALAVAVVTLAVWLPGIRGGYHYDDALTPVSDPASQSLHAWVAHIPDTLRPVTKLTYALEATLGLDDEPAARRVTTIAIHAVAAGLLYLLLLALAPALEPVGAAALATLWAVHPIHAEAVLAIAGRTAALSGALVIGAALAYARDRPRLAAVVLGLAALARETALAAIIAIVAIELATRAGPWRDRARRFVPSVMATIVAAVWIVATPRVRELADFSFNGRPLGASALHQLAAVPVGLSLYARPWALSIDHDSPDSAWLAAIGIALFTLAAVTAVLARRRAPAVAIGATLWLVALVPTQSIVPKLDALTERPLGLALAGITLACAGLFAAHRRALWLIAPISAAFAIATLCRGQLYRSDLLLWGDAAAKSDTHPRPHMNYALFLHLEGRDREALDEVELTHAIDPFDPNITAKRAALAALLGGPDAP